MAVRDEGKRMHLIEAAGRVFRHAGFQTATMAQVAQAAGVSKGLPYHYFESKEELASAVVAFHLADVWDVLASWPATGPEERLRWFVSTALNHARTHADSYRLYLSLALQPTTRDLVLAEVAKRRAMLLGVEEELRSIFSELGHADPGAAALVLRVTVDGLIQYLLIAGDGFPIPEAVSQVMALHCRPSTKGL
jgi:AcrR family transcriptional regulator